VKNLNGAGLLVILGKSLAIFFSLTFILLAAKTRDHSDGYTESTKSAGEEIPRLNLIIEASEKKSSYNSRYRN
jgi:hypothetical protein